MSPACGGIGAVAYAYSYVFFTSTVVYALVAGTPNYKDMTRVSDAWRPMLSAIQRRCSLGTGGRGCAAAGPASAG